MEIIFIIGSIQALFFSILIFNKRKKNAGDYILGTWMLVFFIHFLFPYFAYKDYPKYAWLGGTDAPLLLAHVILLFIYTRSLIRGFRKKYLLHLIWVLMAYICLIPYILLPGETKQQFGENINYATQYLWISGLILLIFCTYYIGLIMRDLRKHRNKIKALFSFEEQINLRWISVLSYGIFIIYLGVFLLIIGMYTYDLKPLTSDYIMYIMLVLFIYVIGYWGYRQNRIFVFEDNSDGNHHPEQRKHSVQNTKEITEAYTGFAEELEHYMMTEKPFLNGKLSLIDLAIKMNTTSHYLSHILNNVMQTNFYDYVNSFRIREVKTRLTKKEMQKYTLLGLAYDCGFNSKASFYRIFKNSTGLSPSEYLLKQKNQSHPFR